METQSSELIVLAVLATMEFFIPGIGAAFPGTQGSWPIVTAPALNITDADIANHSIPSQYEVTPAHIDVRIGINDTSLPGPKGEMAAGPRTIGISVDPLILAVLVVAVVTAACGLWYLARRKPGEPDEGDE